MQRVQMLLEPRQRQKLVELAKRQGKSIADVTRQVIDAGLEQLSAGEHRERMLATMEHLAQSGYQPCAPGVWWYEVTSVIHRYRFALCP